MLLAQVERVNSINFEGTDKTKVAYLESLLTTKHGQVFNETQLKEDILRIIREPAVSFAHYSRSSETAGKIDIIIYVEENKTLIPAVNVWSTLDQNIAFHLGVNDYNFLGQGYTLGGFYRKNIYAGYGLLIENNNFLHWSNELKFIAQQQETLEPLTFGEQQSRYRYRFKTFELLFGKELNIYHKTSFGIGRIYERYQYKEGEQVTGAPTQFRTNKFLGKLGFQVNKIAPYYFYRTGWSNQSFFTYVVGKNVDNSNEFYQFENESLYFKRIKTRGNFAFRMKAGLARNSDSPFPPFVIDNNQNVRGAGNLIQRGNGLWAINIEYRQTLVEQKWFAMQWSFFSDNAGIQPPDEKLNSLVKSKNRHHFAGVGLRFIHKYIYRAVLRLDYGIALHGQKRSGLVFGVGQYF